MSVQEHFEAAPHARVVTDFPESPVPAAAAARRSILDRFRISVHHELDQVEAEWRRFEAGAECTAFQTFDWQSAWQLHIGAASGSRPAIVVVRAASGEIVMLAPFAVSGGLIRQLTWGASDLSDYNAPLLAPDFSKRVPRESFPRLWRAIVRQLRRDPHTRFDSLVLTKMPETVAVQPNPFLALPVSLNPSGAYLTYLGDEWESFYVGKRSSATRRRDRTKRKRLNDMGAVTFATPADASGTEIVLTTLFRQKARSFAKMGVQNFLALPGREAFFRDLATAPATRAMCHVSRLDVGETLAAANYGVIFRGRYYHVLASYDDGPVSRFGPGAAHLHDLMRYAIEHGCREFDFTIGDEPYKRDWCDVEMKLHDHRSAATLRGWAAAVPGIAFAHAKRVIKQTPFLWRLFVKARALTGRAPPQAAPQSAEKEADDGA